MYFSPGDTQCIMNVLKLQMRGAGDSPKAEVISKEWTLTDFPDCFKTLHAYLPFKLQPTLTKANEPEFFLMRKYIWKCNLRNWLNIDGIRGPKFSTPCECLSWIVERENKWEDFNQFNF